MESSSTGKGGKLMVDHVQEENRLTFATVVALYSQKTGCHNGRDASLFQTFHSA